MLNIDKSQANSGNVLFQNPMTNRQSGMQSLHNQHKIDRHMDLSSGIISPDMTQKILQKEIASKLEARFEMEGIELKELNANDFTPDKVAGRILSFIEAGVSRAGDDEEKKELLEKARQGFEQGFKEARDILEAIGVLNGKVKKDVDKTYDLIQAGFDRLGNPEEKGEQEIGLMNTAALSKSTSAENRHTSVEIITRDGDKVTIDLSRVQKESSSQFYASNGNQTVYGASYSSSSYTNVEYTVKGDLDDDEKAAIDDLLKQLNGVAKDFYQGDIEKAFNKAKEVGFDSDELAKFSVEMSFEKTNTAAVSSYQNIQQENNDKDDKSRHHDHGKSRHADKEENAFIRDAAKFMHRLDRLMQHNAFDFMNNSDKAIGDLFKSALELQDNKDSDKANKSGYQTLNEMMQALQNRSHEAEESED